MIRLLVKLALAVFIANAGWRIGSAYVAQFKFRDEVREAATYQRGGDQELRERILALAADLDIPLDDSGLTIRSEDRQTVIEGTYVKPLDFLPGYQFPWRFTWTIDAYALAERKPSGLQELKKLEGAFPDSSR